MQICKPAKLAVLAIVTGLLGVAPYASPAWSQSSAKLSAVSYLPISPDDTFEVRTLDNSEENMELVNRMKEALRLRGRGVKDDSRLVLTVEPRDEIGSGSSSQRHIMSFTGESSTSYEDSTELRFNLFDSQKGGILNKGDQPGGGVNPSEYVLRIRVEDRTNGRQLWEGWASAKLVEGDGNQLLKRMIPPLADSIGKTISEQPISMQ